MSTNPQHTLEKAEKLINLAQSGTAGERQAAMSKLNNLLQAHNMTVDDLGPEPEPCNAFGYMLNSIRHRIKDAIQ